MAYRVADLSDFGITSHSLRPARAEQRLLLAYAHPDDESFGNAGTIARYVDAGVGVHYVCATRGECGGVAPELLTGYSGIAALREAELNAAAHALGLASYQLLNYRDSGMPDTPENEHPSALVQAPLEEVIGKVVATMRVIQPQVVITFNPYGGYGHPDHIVMHKATVAAFERADDPSQFPEQIAAGLEPWQPRKLYYSTFNGRFLRLLLKVLPLFGVDPRRGGENNDVDFVRVVEEITPSTTVVECGKYLKQMDAAWRAHRSQLGSMRMVLKLPRTLRRLYTQADHFTRVQPPVNGDVVETDLFANIEG